MLRFTDERDVGTGSQPRRKSVYESALGAGFFGTRPLLADESSNPFCGHCEAIDDQFNESCNVMWQLSPSKGFPAQLENNHSSRTSTAESKRRTVPPLKLVRQNSCLRTPPSETVTSQLAFKWNPLKPFNKFAGDQISSSYCASDRIQSPERPPSILPTSLCTPSLNKLPTTPLGSPSRFDIDGPVEGQTDPLDLCAVMRKKNALSVDTPSTHVDDIVLQPECEEHDGEVVVLASAPYSILNGYEDDESMDSEIISAAVGIDSRRDSIASCMLTAKQGQQHSNVQHDSASLLTTAEDSDTGSGADKHATASSSASSSTAGTNGIMRRRATEWKRNAERVHDEERKMSNQIKRSYFEKPHEKPHESLDFDLLVESDLPQLQATNNTNSLMRLAESTCGVLNRRPTRMPLYPVETRRKLKKVKRWQPNDQFVVEKIVEKHYDEQRHDYQYKLKWKGYDETTWEHTKNLSCWELAFDFEVKEYWQAQRDLYQRNQANSIGPFLSWDAIEAFGTEKQELLVDYRVHEILASGIVPGATPYYLVKLRRLSQAERDERGLLPSKPPADKPVLMIELMPKNVVMRHAPALYEAYAKKLMPF